MKKLMDKLTSPGALKFVCYILITAAAICAVDSGVHGRWAEMRNHINWVIWVSLVVILIINVERREEEIEVKDSYIKALEDYKVLTDEHIVGLKELIEAHKTRSEGLEEQIETHKKLNVINEKIIEEYKNAKPSRF
jgi:hypothetical protein